MTVIETRGTGQPEARLRLLATAILISTLMLQLAGCARESSPTVRPNFVLIVVDALWADRLHFAGYDAMATPNFDGLQRQSAWFPNAYATAPWTIPSMASLFVSQLASQHRVVGWGSIVSPDETTFVEILQMAGYETGGWTANRLMSVHRGFTQGFDEYKLVLNPKLKPTTRPGTEFAVAPASEVTRAALDWLERQRASDQHAPFFAYLHYLEPHIPYLCPDGSGDECRSAEADLTQRLLRMRWEFDRREQDLIRSLYDVNVERMDVALGDLMRELEAGGFLDDTWVILTADHGEDLGEGGAYVHGTTLNRPVVHVPLLVSPPSRAGSVVDATVSLVDLAPTILDLAGLPIPDRFGGRSLRPALEGRVLPSRSVVAELLPRGPKLAPRVRHRATVIDGTDALVLARDGAVERFDLSEDPRQEHPVGASMEEFVELLSVSGMERVEPGEASGEDAGISPEMLEHLKALGYVQ